MLRCAVWLLFVSVALRTAASARDYVVAVDVSASMGWSLKGPRNAITSENPVRIEVVRNALLKYLDDLPDGARIELIAFTDTIVAEKEIVLANAAARQEAQAWVRALKTPKNSKTFVWAALRKALQKATVYAAEKPGSWVSVRVLTDGEDEHPTDSLRKVLDDFPQVDGKAMMPDIVLLGSLEGKVDIAKLKREANGRANPIIITQFSNAFPPVLKSSPEKIEAGQPVTFFDNSRGSFKTHEWFVDGKGAGAEKVLQQTFAAPGKHTIRLAVTRADNSRDAAQEDFTAVAKPVTVDFASPPTLMEGQAADLLSRATGDIQGYAWFVGAEKISAERDTRREFKVPGEFTIRHVVTDAAGAPFELSKKITITAKPPPPPKPAAPKAKFHIVGSAFKQRDIVELVNDSEGVITEHAWDLGDEGAGKERNVKFAFDKTGSKKITLTVTGPGGSDATSQEIAIGQKFQEPKVTIEKVGSFKTAPATITYRAQITGDYDGIEWTFSEGGKSTELNPVRTFDKPGDYTATITVRPKDASHKAATSIAKVKLWNRWLLPGIGGGVLLLLALALFKKLKPKPIYGTLTWTFGKAVKQRHELIGTSCNLLVIGISGWEPKHSYVIRFDNGIILERDGAKIQDLENGADFNLDGAHFQYHTDV